MPSTLPTTDALWPAFVAHWRRRDPTAPEQADPADVLAEWEDWQRYMADKSEAGRRAEMEDAR